MAMGVIPENGLTIVGVISAIVLVSSLTLGFVLHDEEQLSFSIDDDSIMNDVTQISSLGPRVAGSAEESLATTYISDRFTEIGLSNVQIEEYQVTGAWFVDAEPEDHQILMHAQLEQGAQNVPGLPDGSAGTGTEVSESSTDITGSGHIISELSPRQIRKGDMRFEET